MQGGDLSSARSIVSTTLLKCGEITLKASRIRVLVSNANSSIRILETAAGKKIKAIEIDSNIRKKLIIKIK
jgi:hypothetical protein